MHPGQRKSAASTSDVLVAASQAAAYSRSVSFFGQPVEGAARWSSTVGRYVVAVLSIAVALAASKAAVTFLHIEPFVSLFLCAIMVAAWFGGFGPGLLATAVGSVAFDYYLVSPINSLAVDPKQLPRVALFLMVALFVNWLSASQRTAARSLRRSRDELAGGARRSKADRGQAAA